MGPRLSRAGFWGVAVPAIFLFGCPDETAAPSADMDSGPSVGTDGDVGHPTSDATTDADAMPPPVSVPQCRALAGRVAACTSDACVATAMTDPGIPDEVRQAFDALESCYAECVGASSGDVIENCDTRCGEAEAICLGPPGAECCLGADCSEDCAKLT